MSYYTDVYLKRLNRDGNTQQERIKTRKEREFELLYLKKTEYLANVLEINQEPIVFECSLQPNSWNESKEISNLLCSTKNKLKVGQIIRVDQRIKEEEKDNLYLVFYEVPDITKGYRKYKLILLDNFVNLTDEYGTTQNSFPVKFVSATSNLVVDSFIYSHSWRGYREPQQTRSFITSDFDFLKKGTHFQYKDKRWEIAGIDNLSIDNIAYVTISERLQKDEEPISSKEIEVSSDNNFFLIGR